MKKMTDETDLLPPLTPEQLQEIARMPEQFIAMPERVLTRTALKKMLSGEA